MAFSPDGTVLASIDTPKQYGPDDEYYDGLGELVLWDTSTGDRRASLLGHSQTLLSLAFSPDGTTLASGSADNTIRLWDMSPYVSLDTSSAPLELPLPTHTILETNYPNPFNRGTWIPYQLHASGHVRLTIYDLRGALVREIDLGYREAGAYLTTAGAARWDGRDQHGRPAASGVYLYRLQAGPVTQGKKMLLLR